MHIVQSNSWDNVLFGYTYNNKVKRNIFQRLKNTVQDLIKLSYSFAQIHSVSKS